MPALPSPGKVIRVVFTYNDGSDVDVLNRLYFSYTGSVSATDAATVATTLGSSWSTNFGPAIVTNFSLTLITVTDLSSSTGVEVATTLSHAGGNAGAKLPSSTCMVVSGHVATRYRGGHTRNYIAGLPQGDLTNANTWSTTSQGTVFTAFTAMIASLTSSPPSDLGTVAAVQVSFYKGFTSVQNPITKRYRNVPTPLATPNVYPITSWTTNAKVGSQRRRNKQSV